MLVGDFASSWGTGSQKGLGGRAPAGLAEGAPFAECRLLAPLPFASWTSSSAGVNYWEAPGSVSQRGHWGSLMKQGHLETDASKGSGQDRGPGHWLPTCSSKSTPTPCCLRGGGC